MAKTTTNKPADKPAVPKTAAPKHGRQPNRTTTYDKPCKDTTCSGDFDETEMEDGIAQVTCLICGKGASFRKE